MIRYQITVQGQPFDVRLLSDPWQESVQVEVNGQVLSVHVHSLPATSTHLDLGTQPGPSAPTSPPGGPAAHLITAPLPGLVKSVAARQGQAVAPGEELLVIEAMKMDNVIRAPCAGVVAAVHASQGRQVEYGEPLLEIRS